MPPREDDDSVMVPEAGAIISLLVVPMLFGMLLQFIVAPDIASPAFFDTLGVVTGVVLSTVYAAMKWLPRKRS